MVENVLIMEVVLIVAGLLVMIGTYKWGKSPYVKKDFLKNSTKVILLVNGAAVLITFVFLSVLGSVLYFSSDKMLSESQSLPTVLSKLKYASSPEDIKPWVETDGEGKFVTDSQMFNTMREEFIKTYIPNAKGKLLEEDPNSLLQALFDKENENSTAVFLMMFEKALGQSSESSQSINGADIAPSSCKWKTYSDLIEKHIEEKLLPGAGMFLHALKTGEVMPENSRAILSSIPASANCATIYSETVLPEDLKVINAQLDLMKSHLESIYQMASVVFGPMQLLMLIVYFAACIVIGFRMQWLREDGKTLHKCISMHTVEDEASQHTLEERYESFLFRFVEAPIRMALQITMLGFVGTALGLTGAMAIVSTSETLKGTLLYEDLKTLMFGYMAMALLTTIVAIMLFLFIKFVMELITSSEYACLSRTE